MRYPAVEKLEVIRLVEELRDPVGQIDGNLVAGNANGGITLYNVDLAVSNNQVGGAGPLPAGVEILMTKASVPGWPNVGWNGDPVGKVVELV